MDISDLTRKIPEIVQMTVDELRNVNNKIALDIHGELVITTPVDTGVARNGWQLDDAGDRIEITNNIPYVDELNKGSSKQAPAGFVESAVDRHTR